MTQRKSSDGERSLARSVDELPDALRSALRRALVFQDGFTLDAFEYVALPGIERGAAQGIDLLSELYERGLVIVNNPDGLAGERRFTFPDALRDVIVDADSTPSPDADATRAHAQYFAMASSTWLEALRGPNGHTALRRLQLERDNLLLACETGLHLGDEHCAIRALLSTEVLFEMNGSRAEYIALVDRVLETGRGAVLPSSLYGSALLSRGSMALSHRLLRRALEDLLEARELAQRAGNTELLAVAALRSGYAAFLANDRQEAAHAFARAEELETLLKDRSIQSERLRILSMVRARQGRLNDALDLGEQATLLADQFSSRREQTLALGNVGVLLDELGSSAAARDHLERALQSATEIGDRRSAARFAAWLAQLERQAGDLRSSEQRLGRALEVFRGLADPAEEAWVRGSLGHLLFLEGDVEEAAAHYSEAVAELPRAAVRSAVAFLGAQAVAEARLGQWHEARAHLTDAKDWIDEAGSPADRTVWEVYSAEVDVHRARAEGDATDTEAAARSLLTRLRADGTRSPSSAMSFALRLLDDALETRVQRAVSVSTTRSKLLVAADGGWFQVDDSERVDLGRSVALKRLLRELAEGHHKAPGVGVGLERLFDAAWPDAKIRSESRASRVYVAIGTLRKRGLSGILQRQDDGYLLEPQVRVRLVDE